MNNITNTFLLAGDKLMPEMQLKQPEFTYSACGPFTKNKQRIQRFMETGDKNYIYRNKLDKTCFQHDMAYGDFKDLKRRTQSDRVLKNRAFEIASNPKYELWSINFLTKNQKELVLKMKLRRINN